jgi:hypothetical protein
MTMTMPARELDRLSRSGLSPADIENLDDDLVGRPVHDRTGEEIGTVEDVLIEPRHLHAPFVLVQWGGLLGLGRQERLVPMEAVERIEPGGVYLNRDKDLVTSAPGYQDNMSLEDAELHYQAIYDLYGITPYWMGPQTTT